MASSNSETMFWFVVFILEAIVIICLNIFALIIFTKKARHSRPCLLLANQCFADCLAGVEVIYHSYKHYITSKSDSINFKFSSTDLAGVTCEGTVFKTNMMFWTLVFDASVLSLALMALERAYAVFKPFKHRVLRKKAYFKAIMATWVMSILNCAISFQSDCNRKSPIIIAFYIVSFIIVLGAVLSIIISYLSIYIKLKFFPIFQNVTRNQNEIKLSKTLFYASVASLVTFMPFSLVVLYERTQCSNNLACVPSRIKYLSRGILFSNSFINIFIYAWRMADFLNSIKKCICCKNEVNNCE